MPLYLRIGTEKTGSTALQAYLWTYRNLLKKHSVIYPENIGAPSHLALWPIMLGDGSRRDALLKWMAPEYRGNHAEMVRRCQVSLEQEHLTAYEDILISSEHLFSCSDNSSCVERLFCFLHRFISDVVVVVYLRHQADIVTSLYSSRIQSGVDVDIRNLVDKTSWLYCGDVLDNIYRIVGPEKMEVRLYEKNIEIVGDFLSLIGLEGAAADRKPEFRNRALDAVQLEILRRLNEHIPAFCSEARNQARSRLVEFIQRKPLGAPMALSPELSRYIHQKFGESNRYLERKYLGGREFRCERRPRAAETAADVDDVTISLLAALWKERKAFEGRVDQALVPQRFRDMLGRAARKAGLR